MTMYIIHISVLVGGTKKLNKICNLEAALVYIHKIKFQEEKEVF